MRRGKEIAQGAHASMAFLTRGMHPMDVGDKPGKTIVVSSKINGAASVWLRDHFTKVTVRVDSEAELLAVYQKAKDAGLTAHLITDAGRTEFDGVPTKTCCAIGPDWSDEIDKVTGELQLY